MNNRLGGLAGCTAVMLAVAMTAMGQETAGRRGLGVGVGARIGTTGVGAEVAVQVVPNYLNVRASYNMGSVDASTRQGDVDYESEIDLQSVMAVLDWHVGGGPFKLVAGGVYNGNKVTGEAWPNEPVTVGGREYSPAEIGSLYASADYDGWGGYLGIGFGNLAAAHRGRWSASLDLGVMFFSPPDLTLESRGGLLSDLPETKARLDAERDDFNENYADWLRYYPVVALGLAVRF